MTLRRVKRASSNLRLLLRRRCHPLSKKRFLMACAADSSFLVAFYLKMFALLDSGAVSRIETILKKIMTILNNSMEGEGGIEP